MNFDQEFVVNETDLKGKEKIKQEWKAHVEVSKAIVDM
jgi:hypothetical protein